MQQLPLIARAFAHGERIAVRSASHSYTYQDLLARSESIARTLLDHETDLDETRVAYLIPPGDRYIAAQWGIWRAGGIAVPLSLSATENELEYTLTDSQAAIVVTTGDHWEKLTGLCRNHRLRLLNADDIALRHDLRLPDVDLERRAMILYTSGTTSKPKGVVTTHACIQAQIESLIEAWNWQADDRIPLFLPLHHIHGIINILSCALWSGAQIDAFPKFDVELITQNIAEHAYTVFMAVPTIYVRLIDFLESAAPDRREAIVNGFTEMRLMVSGSAALPASVHEKWTALTGQKLLERYGMTEIGMALSNPYQGERRPGAVGQPLPGVEIRLVTERGEPVVTEETPGEIQVRGPNVFREYWNRPEATQQAFVDGWFQTGDLAVLENGYYRIMGRNSVDIIKSGGYKLSALEIEAVLLDHPAIKECAVVGIPDETWGEIVAVAVVLQDTETLELEDLRSWSTDRLSHYKVPRKLLTIDGLPRNAMGKVTKPAISKLFDFTV